MAVKWSLSKAVRRQCWRNGSPVTVAMQEIHQNLLTNLLTTPVQ